MLRRSSVAALPLRAFRSSVSIRSSLCLFCAVKPAIVDGGQRRFDGCRGSRVQVRRPQAQCGARHQVLVARVDVTTADDWLRRSEASSCAPALAIVADRRPHVRPQRRRLRKLAGDRDLEGARGLSSPLSSRGLGFWPRRLRSAPWARRPPATWTLGRGRAAGGEFSVIRSATPPAGW